MNPEGGVGGGPKAPIYYRDANLQDLQYGKAIKSGLGTLKKYEPSPVRIQFPKLKAIEITDRVISFEISRDSRGFTFFHELESRNKAKGPRPLGGRKLFNSINDPRNNETNIIIEMKLNQDTLYFREDNYQISRSDLEDKLADGRFVCIASSPGLWSTEKSYGNTWNVEQIKVFPNKVR